MVDVTAPDDASPYDFRFVLSPTMTPAVDTFLLRRQVVGSPLIDVNTMDVRVGDRIEVCPLAIASVEDVAKRIGKFRGGAIFIDYGEDQALSDSLRAFRNHKEVDVFHEPGTADLTADVDFAILRKTATKVPGVRALGPTTQSHFLFEMGIEDRVRRVIENPDTTDEQAEKIIDACERLLDPAQMGTKYKVFGLIDAEQDAPHHGFSHVQSQQSSPSSSHQGGG